MGINVDATISMTFAIGSGLAAVAGVLLCSAYPTLVPTTGSMPGIKAFTAAVFGGYGSHGDLQRPQAGGLLHRGEAHCHPVLPQGQGEAGGGAGLEPGAVQRYQGQGP